MKKHIYNSSLVPKTLQEDQSHRRLTHKKKKENLCIKILQLQKLLVGLVLSKNEERMGGGGRGEGEGGRSRTGLQFLIPLICLFYFTPPPGMGR